MSNLREYINETTVIKDEIYKQFESSICCVICQEVMIDPMICMNCQAQYCKSCQENWSKKSKCCTNRCINTKYEKSILAQGLLNKLKFICKKCEKVIDYEDMKEHILTNCENDSQLKVLKEAEKNNEDEIESVKSKYININNNLIIVIILGDLGVGKTNLIYTFQKNNRNNSKEDISMSINAEIKNNINEAENGKIYQLADGTKVKYHLYDTNGQEKYDALSDNYYRNADGCLLVYDITNQNSFDSIKNKYIPTLQKKCNKNIRIILIGNKTDLNYDRVIKKEEGAKFAADNHFLFQETSCIDNDNVNKAFQSIIEGTIFERKNNINLNKGENIKIKTGKNDNKNNQAAKKKKCG